jgi:hypothetical protein
MGREKFETAQSLTKRRPLKIILQVIIVLWVNGFHIVDTLKIVDFKEKAHYICRVVRSLLEASRVEMQMAKELYIGI